MTADLFADSPATERRNEPLGPGAVVLRAFTLDVGAALVELIQAISAVSPFRHLVTPGGHTMSVAMTNCGGVGWVSDRRGYRYDAIDPETGQPWPAMPALFMRMAADAAAEAGFDGFVPDACLVNRYVTGSRLTMHQDRNEKRDSEPIVSVSLGVPAMFQFGGQGKGVKPLRIPLVHGDVVVWGGPSRMNYHGVLPLKASHHPLTGMDRLNLTFRTAR
jgi:alkylated DNA repair protein (DNA oxidative demethylase)